MKNGSLIRSFLTVDKSRMACGAILAVRSTTVVSSRLFKKARKWARRRRARSLIAPTMLNPLPRCNPAYCAWPTGNRQYLTNLSTSLAQSVVHTDFAAFVRLFATLLLILVIAARYVNNQPKIPRHSDHSDPTPTRYQTHRLQLAPTGIAV